MGNIYPFVRKARNCRTQNVDLVQLDKKRSQLRKIRADISRASKTPLGPAASHALGAVMLLFAALIGIELAFPQLRVFQSIVIVSVIATVLAIIVWRRTTFKSWSALIFDQLAKYEPVNTTAYEELRYEVAQRPDLRLWVVADWCERELAHVGDLRGTVMTRSGCELDDEASARDRFLKK